MTRMKIRRRARRKDGKANYTLRSMTGVRLDGNVLGIKWSRTVTRKKKADVRFSKAH